MIRINLLPEEFRPVQKTKIDLPYFKAVAIVGAIFLAVSAFFYMDYLKALGQLKKTKAEWAKVQPRSAELKKLENEIQTNLKPEKDFLARFVTADKSLTEFMMSVNQYLPESAWLTELRMERHGEGGDLFIKGFSLSTKKHSSIEQIEEYLHQLKEKLPDSRLTLTTTRQKIENAEVTQFVANFKWGPMELKKP